MAENAIEEMFKNQFMALSYQFDVLKDKYDRLELVDIIVQFEGIIDNNMERYNVTVQYYKDEDFITNEFNIDF